MADLSSSTAIGHRAGPIHAYLLLLSGCMSVLASVLIAPVLPRMQAHFSAVPSVEFLVPLALTAPALVIAILSLFVGALADRYGRKRLLVAGLVVYAAFGMAPLWLDSLSVILATRIGVGFTEAVIMTCCTTLIGDYFEGLQRERYLALNTTFASSSAVIFIAVGGALGEFGWRTPFAVYAISLLLAPAILLMLWEPQRKIETGTPGPVPALGETSWHPWHLAGICAVTLVGAIAFMAVQVHIGYLLERVGVTSPGTVGLIASGAQVAVVVGSLMFRVLLRARLATAFRLVIAFGTVGIGFITVGAANSFAGVAAGALITGLGGGILLPTLMCWNMSELPQEHRALGTGAWMAAFFLGQFVTPIVVVGVSGQVGGLSQAMVLLGGLVLPAAVALFAVCLLNSRLRRRPPLANAHHPAHPVAGK